MIQNIIVTHAAMARIHTYNGNFNVTLALYITFNICFLIWFLVSLIIWANTDRKESWLSIFYETDRFGKSLTALSIAILTVNGMAFILAMTFFILVLL
jgi:hypothetical protein